MPNSAFRIPNSAFVITHNIMKSHNRQSGNALFIDRMTDSACFFALRIDLENELLSVEGIVLFRMPYRPMSDE